MPKIYYSPKQDRSSNPKTNSNRPVSSQQSHSPQNQPNFQPEEDQSYPHQTYYQKNNNVQRNNQYSKRLPSHGPPKYEKGRLGNDQTNSKQGHNISRLRQESIDTKGQKQSRSKSKASPLKKDYPSGQSSVKQIGQLHSSIRNIHSEIPEQGDINTPQQRKIRDLHVNMSKLSESLEDLRENYNSFEKQEIKYSKYSHTKDIDLAELSGANKSLNRNKQYQQSPAISASKSTKERKNSNVEEISSKSKIKPKTNQEILQFLQQKQREKQERKIKMSVASEQAKQKLEQQFLQRQKEQQEYLLWRKNQIRNANNFEEKHQKQKETEQTRKRAVQEYSKQIKDKKYIYLLRMKQHEESKQKQFEQKRQKVITQRKQLHKPLDFGEIDQHQKWFYAKRQEILEQKRLLRQDELSKIQQLNSNLPEFWRGSGHQIALEEKKKMKQKLQQPHLKAQKIKEYKQYLNENFLPKRSKSVKEDPAKFDPNKYREIKRYRYYKGVSYGEISQTAPIAKDAAQIKRIGDSNLEIMKKLSRKRKQDSSLPTNSFTPQPQKKFDVNLVRDIFSSVVLKEKAKPAKLGLSQNMKSHELGALLDKVHSKSIQLYNKQRYLDMQGNKNGKNRIEQRELESNLVNNIEMKLNLLSQM